MAISYQNPNSIISGVLSKVPVGDRNKMGVNMGSYIKQLSDLWLTLQEQMGPLNQQETAIQTGYENDLATSTLERQRALDALANAMGDRGLVHSGINLGEQANINQGYDQQVADLGLDRIRDLANLRLKRAGLEGTYRQERGNIEDILAQSAEEYLQGQAANNTALMQYFAGLQGQAGGTGGGVSALGGAPARRIAASSPSGGGGGGGGFTPQKVGNITLNSPQEADAFRRYVTAASAFQPVKVGNVTLNSQADVDAFRRYIAGNTAQQTARGVSNVAGATGQAIQRAGQNVAGAVRQAVNPVANVPGVGGAYQALSRIPKARSTILRQPTRRTSSGGTQVRYM